MCLILNNKNKNIIDKITSTKVTMPMVKRASINEYLSHILIRLKTGFKEHIKDITRPEANILSFLVHLNLVNLNLRTMTNDSKDLNISLSPLGKKLMSKELNKKQTSHLRHVLLKKDKEKHFITRWIGTYLGVLTVGMFLLLTFLFSFKQERPMVNKLATPSFSIVCAWLVIFIISGLMYLVKQIHLTAKNVIPIKDVLTVCKQNLTIYQYKQTEKYLVRVCKYTQLNNEAVNTGDSPLLMSERDDYY